MPQLIWLSAEQKPNFPNTENALDEPEGLLAAGGKLSPEWLLQAYERGIFPWFSEGEPIMWWSPAPRMVLTPGEAHISRSLRKAFRKIDIEIKVNTRFSDIIGFCGDESLRNEGTWITDSMINAYITLHEQGWAHSVEVYEQGKLIGGLYGIGIENVFYGESMFSLAPNASKYALIALSEWAKNEPLSIIDCQLHNPYLESMGAIEVCRESFESHLPKNRTQLSLTNKPNLTQLLRNKLSQANHE
jgi:leucyl/phenylalanyl-tRNA--protein transferase